MTRLSTRQPAALQWSYIDKSTWARGPWDDEPDKYQWFDEFTGMPCLIVRSAVSGSLCGYVGIRQSHPLRLLDRELLNGKAPGYQHEVFDDIDVHGGLTYIGKCQEGAVEKTICHVSSREDDVVWLGFDCAHADDLMPRCEFHASERYRDFAYVKNEVHLLAQQLAQLWPAPSSKAIWRAIRRERRARRRRARRK